MTLIDVLERIRDLNVSALTRALVEHPDAHVEPAYRTDDGSLAVEGPFDLPLRADLIPDDDGVPGDSVVVTPAKALAFDPIAGKIGNADLIIKPFGWDYAEVSARFDSSPDARELSPWFMAWFDPEDDRPAQENGLYGVVHFMSDPEVSDSTIRFTVDFGSAPVDAFFELMEKLVKIGALRIEIG
jgi:hypothetical protein